MTAWSVTEPVQPRRAAASKHGGIEGGRLASLCRAGRASSSQMWG